VVVVVVMCQLHVVLLLPDRVVAIVVVPRRIRGLHVVRQQAPVVGSSDCGTGGRVRVDQLVLPLSVFEILLLPPLLPLLLLDVLAQQPHDDPVGCAGAGAGGEG
jgi:hypothetical protein